MTSTLSVTVSYTDGEGTDEAVTSAATPPIEIREVPDFALEVGGAPSGVFGNRYAEQTDADGKITGVFSVADTSKDLELSLTTFDVDFANELEVFLNGTSLGYLDTTANNGLGNDTVLLPSADLIAGRNELTIQNKGANNNWVWGVDGLQVAEVPDFALEVGGAPTGVFGNRYAEQTDADGKITGVFSVADTSKDLELSLTTFDVDFANELEVFLNGTSLGYLDTTANNGLGNDTVLLPSADLIAGRNELTIQNKGANNNWVWGVDGLQVAEVPDFALEVGGAPSGVFGNRYAEQTDADGKITGVFSVADTSKDLELSLTTFDVDFANELEVFLNGTSLGYLDTTANNGLGNDTVLLPSADLIAGRNELTIQNKGANNNWVWGVDGLQVAEVPDFALEVGGAPSGVFGNRYAEQTDADGKITGVFSVADTSKDLELSLTTFDVDFANELEVFLNGTSLGYLDTTANNGLGNDTVLLPSADLIAGRNELTIQNKGANNNWVWGVDGLQVAEVPEYGPYIFSESSFDLNGYSNSYNLTLGGSANIYGYGNENDNTILGNSGSNVLKGRGGSDVLKGFAGNDELYGGDRDDRLHGGDGNDLLDASGGRADTHVYGDHITPGLGNDTVLGHAGLWATGEGSDISYGDLSGVGGVTIVVGSDGAGTARSGDGRSDDSFTFIHAFNGSQDADYIVGGDEADRWEGFQGFGGNDIINGRSGTNRASYEDERYFGGAAVGITGIFHSDGNTLRGEVQDTFGDTDTLVSINQVQATAYNDTLDASGSDIGIRFLGEEGDDRLIGSQGEDKLEGGDGNDELFGGGGRDYIYGGDGNDYLIGSHGNDELKGDDGNDYLSGGDGDDWLFGGAGDDTIDGGDGEDWLIGGAGDDTIDGGTGFDRIDFRESTSSVEVNLSSGTAVGAAIGSDAISNIERIIGSNFDDVLIGSSTGDDVWESYTGGTGNDIIDGAGGNDYVWYGRSDGAVQVDLATGIVTGGEGEDRLISIEWVGGSNFADTLLGSEGDDGFQPDALGDDGAGSNFAVGGADLIDGKGGVDTVSYSNTRTSDGFNPAGVIANLALGEVRDSAGNLDTLINIENITGSAYDDHIIGDEYANVLRGEGGNDTLVGGAGDDTYVFEFHGIDTINDNSGNDTLVADTISDNGEYRFRQLYQDNGQLTLEGSRENTFSKITMSGIESIKWGEIDSGYTMTLGVSGEANLDTNRMYVGTLSDDVLVTGQGDYVEAYGAEGNDTITIVGGSSWATGDAGHDTLIGGSGNDMLKGDYTTGFAGNDTLEGNGGDDWLEGNKGNDTLVGGAGDDELYGGVGSDMLEGGAGQDLMFAGVDSDSDIFIFRDVGETGTGTQRDRIYEFGRGQDNIHLRHMDANINMVEDQNFLFSSNEAAANSVWISESGNDIVVRGDVNGDIIHDFEILVADLGILTVDDFIL